MIKLRLTRKKLNRILISRRRILFPLFIILIFVFGASFAIRTLAQVTSVPTYFVGCLESNKGVLYNVSFGTTPPPTPTCKSGDNPVDWANGDIQSVVAGTGLTGGGLAGDVGLSLAQSFRLPQGCTDGQVGKWNIATGLWDCAGDNSNIYVAGQGLNLIGNQFNLADLGVTTAKLADSSVTSAKLDSSTKTRVSSKAGISGSTNIPTPPTTMVDLTVTVDVPSTIFLIVTGDVSSETQDWIYTNIERDGIVLKGLGVDRPTNPMVRTPYSDSVTSYAVGPGTYVYTANIAPTGPTHFVYWENISFTAMVFPN